MGDGAGRKDASAEAAVATSKNSKKNRQKKRKREQRAAEEAAKLAGETGDSLVEKKTIATVPKKKTKQVCKPCLPQGIPSNIAVLAIQAFRAEFIDGAEDCFADFIDGNDVSDDIEDLLFPYVRSIGKKDDKEAAINALEEQWGLTPNEACEGDAAGKPPARKKKKKMARTA